MIKADFSAIVGCQQGSSSPNSQSSPDLGTREAHLSVDPWRDVGPSNRFISNDGMELSNKLMKFLFPTPTEN